MFLLHLFFNDFLRFNLDLRLYFFGFFLEFLLYSLFFFIFLIFKLIFNFFLDFLLFLGFLLLFFFFTKLGEESFPNRFYLLFALWDIDIKSFNLNVDCISSLDWIFNFQERVDVILGCFAIFAIIEIWNYWTLVSNSNYRWSSTTVAYGVLVDCKILLLKIYLLFLSWFFVKFV